MKLSIILFIISISGIIFMISRKFNLITEKETVESVDDDFFFEVPDINDLRVYFNKKIRRFGYVMIVIGMRLYFRSAEFSKSKFKEIKEFLSNYLDKNKITLKKINKIEKKAENQFLKTISEYKKKVHRIKKKIKEEEGLN